MIEQIQQIQDYADQRNHKILMDILIFFGGLAGLIVIFFVIVKIFSHFKDMKNLQKQGFDCALMNKIPQVLDNAKHMKHVEKGWNKGLKFVVEREKKQEMMKLKKEAFDKRIDGKEFDGALSLTEKK